MISVGKNNAACITRAQRLAWPSVKEKTLLSLWDSHMLHNPAYWQKHIYSDTNKESDNRYKWLQWKKGRNTQWNWWTDGNTDDLSRSTTFTRSFCNHHSFMVFSSNFNTNMYNVQGYFTVKNMKKQAPKSFFILWLISYPLLQCSEMSKSSHARAIKMPLLWYLIIPGLYKIWISQYSMILIGF